MLIITTILSALVVGLNLIVDHHAYVLVSSPAKNFNKLFIPSHQSAYFQSRICISPSG